jgi:hypothetical protein
MADVALLAPVPVEHLRSALEKPNPEARAVFSTNRSNTLDKLEKLLGGQRTEVYICDGAPKGKVTWRATFERLVDPADTKYRPESTKTDTPSNTYYEVSNLRHLPESEWISVDQFCGHGKAGHYAANYRPRTPTLVNPISN